MAGLRVVVVGATGNIGTAVIRSLAQDPLVESITGVARRVPKWQPTKTQWTSADMASDDLTDVVAGADAVVHTAWAFQPTHDPRKTWRTNVEGTMRVVDAVRAMGVSTFLYASSVGAYSPRQAARPVDESWPTNGWPEAAYTREKAYLERLLDVVERDQPELRVVRMRPGFVFQRGAASEQRRIFGGPFVPGRLIGPEGPPIVPDINGLLMQVVHAGDVAEAFRLALHQPVRGAFNLAAIPVLDPRALAELCNARLVRVPRPVARAGIATMWHARVIPTPPTMFDALLHLPVMDTTRARVELGWAPGHGAEQTLKEFFAGLSEGAGDQTPPLVKDTIRGRLKELLT